MKTVRILLLGFGNAGRAYCKLLVEKEADIIKSTGYKPSVVGIVTGTKGKLIDSDGIDLVKVLDYIKKNTSFDSEWPNYTDDDGMNLIDTLDYDVLIELTPLNIESGEPAITHIKKAFKRNKHVITGNKGPIAFAYGELKEMAEEFETMFFYETTVMDGTPIFNLVEDTLPLCKVEEVSGIFNTTTNFVLVEMASGKTYDEAIEEGKIRGFVEADPAMDIEGYDAAAKTTALINVLMNANITPNDIDRNGIENITIKDIMSAKSRGKVIKLLCKGYYEDGVVRGVVSPEEVDVTDVLGTIDGTTSIIKIKTDLMGEISVIEHNPEIEQTGFGIFSDTLRLLKKYK